MGALALRIPGPDPGPTPGHGGAGFDACGPRHLPGLGSFATDSPCHCHNPCPGVPRGASGIVSCSGFDPERPRLALPRVRGTVCVRRVASPAVHVAMGPDFRQDCGGGFNTPNSRAPTRDPLRETVARPSTHADHGACRGLGHSSRAPRFVATIRVPEPREGHPGSFHASASIRYGPGSHRRASGERCVSDGALHLRGAWPWVLTFVRTAVGALTLRIPGPRPGTHSGKRWRGLRRMRTTAPAGAWVIHHGLPVSSPQSVSRSPARGIRDRSMLRLRSGTAPARAAARPGNGVCTTGRFTCGVCGHGS